jgi:electron transport complex protein RnfG
MTVGILSSLVLAASYTITEPVKQQKQREELQRSIFVVLPEAKECERTDDGACKNIGTDTFQVYKGLDEQNQSAGYAFVAEGSGFQDNIRMIVGIEDDLDTLLGMKVLEQAETPGLGAKIALETPKTDFFELFDQLPLAELAEGQDTADFIVCLKADDPNLQNDIQAITGATISSKAVVDIINQSLVKLHQVISPE